MVMSWIFTGLLALSLIAAGVTGNRQALAAALPEGAQKGITLAISLAGSMCLWTGLGALMERIGVTGILGRILEPILKRVFPATREDKILAGYLSGNICANVLGLGNAATPMGIQAACRMAANTQGVASHELCRLVVLNTASIQLIPATVAAVRAGCGCQSPFDILPAVWLTSLCSAGLGLAMAFFLGRVWRHA